METPDRHRLKARPAERQGVLADREKGSGVEPFVRRRALERAPRRDMGQNDDDVGQYATCVIRYGAGDGSGCFLRKDARGNSNEEDRRAAREAADPGAHDSLPLGTTDWRTICGRMNRR